MLHIIDDEEVVRDSLSWLAASRSIEARSYASAQQFLDSLDGTFDAAGDCVLLDVRMPDMNGIALFDQLVKRDLTARLPVIFLTGHGDVPMAVDTAAIAGAERDAGPEDAVRRRVAACVGAAENRQGEHGDGHRRAALHPMDGSRLFCPPHGGLH